MGLGGSWVEPQPSCRTRDRRSDADTAYRFSAATRDAHGVWGAESGRFVTELHASTRKRGSSRSDEPGPRVPYLRTTFDLPGGTSHAVVYTAAAHKYLWVNGQKLDTGPSFCYPNEQYVQATERERCGGRR